MLSDLQRAMLSLLAAGLLNKNAILTESIKRSYTRS